MRFAYTYRSSDGQRHTAEIEAESRDAAFAKVRAELGIKPIKVTAAGPEEGEDRDKRHFPVPGVPVVPAVPARLALPVLLVLAVAAAAGAWWWLRRAGDGAPYQVMTPQGPVTYSVATPLPRQAIPGSRQRVEAAVAQERDPPVFAHAAERWLARYAEPGRKIDGLKIEDLVLKGDDAWRSCLREPIRIASTDFTEVVDLKRIVAGMKREMKAYLAGGGTAEGYLAELEKRQRLELSYRERAEQKLEELLKEQNDGGRNELRPSRGGSPYAAAYAYWLKANAQLQAMGIYPLALPDALRSYQMGLDIEE
jgi:hypothetical protein